MSSDAAHHRFRVATRVRSLALDVRVELTAPWTVLFGASGAGKSTVLRGLCGLLSPQACVEFLRLGNDRFVHFENGSIVDVAAEPTHERSLGYAPQQAALFPHLTVARNISFGRDVCNDPQRASPLVEDAVALFRVHALADRMPRELSGGEAQRVALARAFATPKARLLLLDEPFSGMDHKLRDELLPQMRAWCAEHKLPVLSVTHDVDEALLLDADVVRIEHGNVVAQGAAHDVLANERTRMLNALGA